jgi:SAM-dependent methyltransferase
VFEQLLSERRLRPGRTLVLGCGTGHDAVLFARHGFEVTAVDFSAEAIAAARVAAGTAGVSVAFLHCDLFGLIPAYDEAFDCVIEYVTYCAIDPVLRVAYANVVSRLTAPGGLFVALFFPVERREGGPPFSVSMEEVDNLFSRHLRLVSTEEHPKTIAPRKGREVLTIWRKPLRGATND